MGRLDIEPGYWPHAHKLGGINFRQRGIGRHILYAVINTGQKNSPMRAGGKVGEIFFLAKINNDLHIQVGISYGRKNDDWSPVSS